MVLPEGNTVIGVFALKVESILHCWKYENHGDNYFPIVGQKWKNARLKRWGILNKVDLEKAETYMKSFQKNVKGICLIIANEIY